VGERGRRARESARDDNASASVQQRVVAVVVAATSVIDNAVKPLAENRLKHLVDIGLWTDCQMADARTRAIDDNKKAP
jgi:hypothetical protein